MSADPFVREAREDVERLSEGLVELEGEGADRETVDELFRHAHSLKGSLGMEGYDGASDLAHALEDLLDAVRAAEVDPEGELVDRGLDAVDALAETLDEVERTGELTTDHDATVESLRTAVEAARPAATDDVTEGEAPTTAGEPDVDELLADAEAEADPTLSAEEALASASEFDDLDALAESVDEEEAAAYENLEGGGSMPPAAADDPESAGPADDPDEEDADDRRDGVGGDDVFASVKADVADEEPPVEELDAEIEAEAFGEFDDDDDMSIEELVGLDPDEEPPEPVETTPDEEPPEPVETTPDEGADPTGGGKRDEFAWVRENVDVEESVEELDAAIEAESFGEYDDDDDLSIEELVDLDPDEEPPEPAPSVAPADLPEPDVPAEPGAGGETDASTADADTDESASDATAAAETDASTADAPRGGAGGADADRPAVEAADPDAGASDPDPVGTLAADLDAERGEVAAVVDDLTRADETAADLDPSTVEAELAAAEEELASIAAELDEVEIGADDGETEAEAGFERDSELEAFESRFEGLFDRGADEERGRRAVGTLAESSVDPETYRLPGAEGAGRGVGASGDIKTLTVDVENADELLSLVEELSVHTRRLSEELAARPASDPVSRALSELGATTRDLQRTVMDVRLMPLSTVTGGLERVVRDAARGTETEARIEVEGEDVRLDRSIIDRLGDPIVHLVRNAVDHGIEPADEREAAGKPREGTVSLRARRDGSEVVVEVEDDGRGVDVDAVFERAVERELVAPDADPTEAETLDLLFHPGFSTAETVTKTSGRGVGLDVVRDVAEALNGDVAVETEAGGGTTVRLRLPVSVATLEVLFVEAGGERYALPMDAVEHVGREGGARIAGGGEEGLLTPELRGDAVDLSVAMGAGGTSGDAAVVRLSRDGDPVALRCDRVLNTRDVVISPYDDLLAEVPGLTGTTMTDDGRLVNVVDVEQMDVAATEDT